MRLIGFLWPKLHYVRLALEVLHQGERKACENCEHNEILLFLRLNNILVLSAHSATQHRARHHGQAMPLLITFQMGAQPSRQCLA